MHGPKPCALPLGYAPSSLGWMMGFEPTASGATILRSNQLSYIHHKLLTMARLRGFEPLTYGLEVRCSIQLSYRRSRDKLERVMGIEPTQLAWKARALPLSYTRSLNYILERLFEKSANHPGQISASLGFSAAYVD
ncbi:MAG: hypothetical protein PWQ96_181 [Clostridia bacterium]|nr:uncharacterized protein [Clostridiales bacterium]MDK2984539.1 hypothetical protein [Clostridia bacterium]